MFDLRAFLNEALSLQDGAPDSTAVADRRLSKHADGKLDAPENRRRCAANRARRLAARDPRQVAVNAAVNRLSNWQHTRWLRAGCPGKSEMNPVKIEPFSRLCKGMTDA